MSAIRVEAHMDGLYGFIGGVEGVIDAIQTPEFKDDFTDHIMNDLKQKFTVSAIAMSGNDNMKHVFEWGMQQGESSEIPLFRITKKGAGGIRQLSYHFVPSTVPVPLPDPRRYGFDATKLDHMKRHIFKYKAIVMESGAQVTIHNKWSEHGLFIPTTSNKYGYVMTKKTVTVRPGGKEAAGGFSKFWSGWFETEAPVQVRLQSTLTEQFIAKTARYVLRDTAGRFASGSRVGVGYVSSAKRTAELSTLTAAKKYFSDGPVDWEN